MRDVLPIRTDHDRRARSDPRLGQAVLDGVRRAIRRQERLQAVPGRQRLPDRLHDVRRASREAHMTVLGATFVADSGTVVHVENSTRSGTEGCCVALCGKRFLQAVMTNKQATCNKCRKLDDPFHAGKVPYDPSAWVAILRNCRAGQPNARSALLSRDLITPQGVVTPRGLVLARDFTNPVPWVDNTGITHARPPAGGRLRGTCGTDLLGIRQQAGSGGTSYTKLARATELYADAIVDCMTCLTVIARSP